MASSNCSSLFNSPERPGQNFTPMHSPSSIGSPRSAFTSTSKLRSTANTVERACSPIPIQNTSDQACSPLPTWSLEQRDLIKQLATVCRNLLMGSVYRNLLMGSINLSRQAKESVKKLHFEIKRLQRDLEININDSTDDFFEQQILIVHQLQDLQERTQQLYKGCLSDERGLIWCLDRYILWLQKT